MSTQTIQETVAEAGKRIASIVADAGNEEVHQQVSTEGPREVVTDNGYQSRAVVSELTEWGLRTYCSEPNRGRQSGRIHGLQRELGFTRFHESSMELILRESRIFLPNQATERFPFCAAVETLYSALDNIRLQSLEANPECDHGINHRGPPKYIGSVWLFRNTSNAIEIRSAFPRYGLTS